MTPLWWRQRGTNEPLDENEKEWKSWLKTQHSKNEDYGFHSHHFIANRWGNNGNSGRFIFLGSKITADGACSHELRRRLLLGRKPMTNLDSVLKSKDINSSTKVHTVKAMVFPVAMYRYENWTIKNAERNILLSNYLCFDSTGKALEKDLSSQLPVLNTLRINSFPSFPNAFLSLFIFIQ